MSRRGVDWGCLGLLWLHDLLASHLLNMTPGGCCHPQCVAIDSDVVWLLALCIVFLEGCSLALARGHPVSSVAGVAVAVAVVVVRWWLKAKEGLAGGGSHLGLHSARTRFNSGGGEKNKYEKLRVLFVFCQCQTKVWLKGLFPLRRVGCKFVYAGEWLP
eukprot:1161593-Pelagomonas_calceolata.AAC.5